MAGVDSGTIARPCLLMNSGSGKNPGRKGIELNRPPIPNVSNTNPTSVRSGTMTSGGLIGLVFRRDLFYIIRQLRIGFNRRIAAKRRMAAWLLLLSPASG